MHTMEIENYSFTTKKWKVCLALGAQLTSLPPICATTPKSNRRLGSNEYFVIQ